MYVGAYAFVRFVSRDDDRDGGGVDASSRARFMRCETDARASRNACTNSRVESSHGANMFLKKLKHLPHSSSSETLTIKLQAERVVYIRRRCASIFANHFLSFFFFLSFLSLFSFLARFFGASSSSSVHVLRSPVHSDFMIPAPPRPRFVPF